MAISSGTEPEASVSNSVGENQLHAGVSPISVFVYQSSG